MLQMKKYKFDNRIAVILSGMLGAVVFLLIYGPYSLNVCEDSWILMQYDGPDIIQNYAGWTQYRISDWNYPLGYANTLAYGDGTYITYTDSIPYVAIICKLFRNILPETFQYFGWFTLVCFVLQGIGAGLLIKRRYPSYFKILAGDVFFLTAPVLIERVFKHTALGAQWFILFALYYYLEYRGKEKDAKLPWQLILLAGLTVGIHPYFLPMVMIFVLAVIVEALIKGYSVRKIMGFALASIMVPCSLGVVMGVLGTKIEHTTRAGYGYFSMNLNALFNPESYGGFIWSHILPQRGQALETYEGFNYLGLGMLLMAGICLILFVAAVVRNRNYLYDVAGVLKRNIVFLCCMLFMTLFAVSNILTWDNDILFMITIPKKLIEWGSIFRSSGRMFYPVYYALMLAFIYYLLEQVKPEIGGILLAALLFIQVYDMRDVYLAKHELMKENYGRETIMHDEVLKDISGKEVLAMIGAESFELQRILTVWAASRNMGVTYSIANTGEYKNAESFTQSFAEGIEAGLILPQVVYVTQEEERMEKWRSALEGEAYKEYKRGFYYIVYTE